MTKKFTNSYMLFYALGMAAVVAIVLTVVAMSLKERQQANIENEKMQMLLATIGVKCDRNEAKTEYSKYFTEELNIAEEGEEPLKLYIYEKDGLRGYVVPTTGNGLWGKIYANIALADDFNTITGITFNHDGETPGLGAEITSDDFCNQFVGKKILDDNGKVVSVAVVKHADAADLHQVDAISGGTMTSNGVSQMLAEELVQYQDYITNHSVNTNNRKEENDGK